MHAPSIETAVRQLSPRQRENPHYAELAARLADVADADGRGALMMAADLAGVERAVSEWGRALPPSPNSEIRVALAFPLAHMLFDVRQLQARLQATVEVADEERARLREAAAAAEPAPPAPAAAMEDIPAAEVPAGLEPRAVVDTATEPPALESGEPSRAGGGGGPDTVRAEEVGVALTVEEEDLEESVQAAPTNEPTAAPGTPGTDASFTPRDGLAEAAVAVSGEPDREGEDVPAGAEVRQTDHMGAGAAVPTGDLPLWKTDELPLRKGRPTDDAPEAPVVLSAASQQDLDVAFGSVMEAYAEIVPEDQGTAKDLYDDVQDQLRILQELLGAATRSAAPQADSSPPVVAAAAQPAPADQAEESHSREPRGAERDASEVNSALRQAGPHTPQLQDLPEWQQIQTIGGAVRHLWQVVKIRTGAHFEHLAGDERVDGFFRTLSVRVCQKVADLAQAGADRLRRGKTGAQGPAEEALQRLGDAARTYGSPRAGSRGISRPGEEADIPAMREMGKALAKPMPGVRPKVSAAAATSRSTTAKRPVKKPAADTEQAAHLRRGADQPQSRKPQQR
ncbi:hypothetical protein ABTX82_27905 [Streptomyces lavendulae]|uniref:hypothetical protein n=1 Tax=Streptomyces lavendulae TaxID=1914 RepID=UPI003318B139